MEHIINNARRLISRFGTREPDELAEASGVNLWYRPLGELKGFYTYERRSRYIVINTQLERHLRKVVIAHELGHDQLHRAFAGAGIRDTTLFLSNNKTEREANLFAAEILIDEDEILDAMKYHDTVNAVASILRLPKEIVGFKLQIMKYEGYRVNSVDIMSDFLK